MEVKVGHEFKVNNASGEIVTVLYVPKKDNNLLLLRESGNVIRANGVFFEGGSVSDGPYIYWNNGDYADSDIFGVIYEELGQVVKWEDD